MSYAAVQDTQPERWAAHQQLVQLLRDLDTAGRVRPYLVPSSLAYQRIEREQARIEAIIESVRRQGRAGE